jgi:ubiquinone/menaquinone biosynthesis C-methylase UbiE
MCCYLLELLSQEDISLTLREIHRVLRPGGRFSLVVIGQNVGFFNQMYKVAGTLVPAFWGRQVELAAHNMVEEAGFRVVKDEFVRQGFYPSRVLIAESQR